MLTIWLAYVRSPERVHVSARDYLAGACAVERVHVGDVLATAVLKGRK